MDDGDGDGNEAVEGGVKGEEEAAAAAAAAAEEDTRKLCGKSAVMRRNRKNKDTAEQTMRDDIIATSKDKGTGQPDGDAVSHDKTTHVVEQEEEEERNALLRKEDPTTRSSRERYLSSAMTSHTMPGTSQSLIVSYMVLCYGSIVMLYVLLLALAEVFSDAAAAHEVGSHKPPKLLRSFDRLFRSPLGPLCPFVAYFVCLGTTPQSQQHKTKSFRPRPRLASLLALFITLTVVRLLIYEAILSLRITGLMSDHVFLAICISAMLQTVVLLSLLTKAQSANTNTTSANKTTTNNDTDIDRSSDIKDMWQQRVSIIGVCFACAIILMLSANSFVTFRYFHDFSEVRFTRNELLLFSSLLVIVIALTYCYYETRYDFEYPFHFVPFCQHIFLCFMLILLPLYNIIIMILAIQSKTELDERLAWNSHLPTAMCDLGVPLLLLSP